MKSDIIRSHFTEAGKTLEKFLSGQKNMMDILKAGELMSEALKNGNKIISCGNGGSMCDAMHFAEELAGNFRENRKPLAAIAISDPSYITCTANDYGFDKIFSRYVEGLGKKGDVLFAISTSGNSKNILNAVRSAKKTGMAVIGLTGKNGGALGPLCDVEIRAPQTKYSDRVQEIHIKVIHALIDFIETAPQPSPKGGRKKPLPKNSGKKG